MNENDFTHEHCECSAALGAYVLRALPADEAERTRRHFAETTPLQRPGTPEDVVAAVRFLLASDYATGTVLVVDGGRLLR